MAGEVEFGFAHALTQEVAYGQIRESSIMVAAIAASRGSLWIVAVLLVAIMAAILGDNLGYLCGRTFGR